MVPDRFLKNKQTIKKKTKQTNKNQQGTTQTTPDLIIPPGISGHTL